MLNINLLKSLSCKLNYSKYTFLYNDLKRKEKIPSSYVSHYVLFNHTFQFYIIEIKNDTFL